MTETILEVIIVLFTIYAIIQIALAYFFPNDT